VDALTGAASDAQARALVQRLRAALTASADDAALARRGGFLQARCLIGVGGESALLTIERGKLALQHELAPLTSWDFAIRASAHAWSEFWRDPPPPGWHDLFALAKRGELSMEGDLQPLMANLQYVKDLLALPRGRGGA
jgi:hypothetical protein